MDAMRNLGLLYEKGTLDALSAYEQSPKYTRDININEAIKWHKRAAEAGMAAGQLALGNSYFTHYRADGTFTFNEKGDYGGCGAEQAVVWWRKAAVQGHAKAEFNLADSYREGRGVERDDREAHYWYLRAEKHGKQYGFGVGAETVASRAQYYLGMYSYHGCPPPGCGVPINKPEGVAWWRQAASCGCGQSQRMVKAYDYASSMSQQTGWVNPLLFNAACEFGPHGEYAEGAEGAEGPGGGDSAAADADNADSGSGSGSAVPAELQNILQRMCLPDALPGVGEGRQGREEWTQSVVAQLNGQWSMA
jgi:TPR repeat protein